MLHIDSSSQSLPPVQTLTDRHGDNIEDLDIPNSTVSELPPESFWLSKDAEFDWFDRNAFLERKESTRGNLNSMNLNSSVNHNNPSHSNSSSQRYSVSLKSKPPIIGLPKTHKTTYVDLKCRQCKTINVRLFPKQLYSVTEPSSPKVSCIGRVRSKSRMTSSQQAVEPVKSPSQRAGTSRAHKSGLISRIISLFRCRKTGKLSTEKVKKPVERSSSRRICVSVIPVNSEPGTPSEPPALGGMNRFASGGRSDYWEGLENGDVAVPK